MASVSLLISLMTVANASGFAPFSHNWTHKANESGSKPVLSSRESSCRVLNVSLAAKILDEVDAVVEAEFEFEDLLFEVEFLDLLFDEEAIFMAQNWTISLFFDGSAY